MPHLHSSPTRTPLDSSRPGLASRPRRSTRRTLTALAHASKLAASAALLSACGSDAAPTGETSSQALSGGSSITDSTGLCVDDAGGNTASGTAVQLWTCNGTPAQTWTLTSGALVGPGGKCLDVQWGGTANGTLVQLWDCNGTPAQQWSFTNGTLVGNGGKCLDVNAFHSVPGQRLEIWDCNGGTNQQFSSGATTPPPPPPPPTDPCAGQTCSGHGTCTAGACTCDPGYTAAGLSCLSGSADVTVLTTSPTGKNVSPYIYGLSSGAIADNNFAFAADSTIRSSLHTLQPTLMRINADNDVADADDTNWFANAPAFMDPNYRFVVGVSTAFGDTSVSPSDWAAKASAAATRFKNEGHEVTYWEVGNENSFDASLYSQYFNAIADALHAVNPSYLVGGTVGDWWGAIDTNTFIANTGSRAGFFDFHSYCTGPSDSVSQVYTKAFGCGDMTAVRQALAGSAIANIPLGLLEYNMDGNPGEEPRQATYVGAMYTSILLTQAFSSDPSFTMAGLWDALGDSYYGVVGNEASGYDNSKITPQGYYLGHAGQHLGGAEIKVSTSVTNVQVLATLAGKNFALQLINYDTSQDQTLSVAVAGSTPTSITRWELGKSSPNAPTVGTQSDLGSVSVPSESIVILTGTLP